MKTSSKKKLLWGTLALGIVALGIWIFLETLVYPEIARAAVKAWTSGLPDSLKTVKDSVIP
jgi:hypothetical protein